LPKTEYENRIAVAKLQAQPSPPMPRPAQVAQPTVSPQPVALVSSQPVPVMPKPWIVRNWKGLAIGGGILLVLLILACRLNHMAARAQAEQEPQRRVAREQLRKLFDRIMIAGERPGGKNRPDGGNCSHWYGTRRLWWRTMVRDRPRLYLGCPEQRERGRQLDA